LFGSRVSLEPSILNLLKHETLFGFGLSELGDGKTTQNIARLGTIKSAGTK